MTAVPISLPANLTANPMLDRWLTRNADQTFTVRSGKVELGQGTATALAAIAARELGLRLDQINVEAASTLHGPDEGYTAGSFSIEHGGAAMRYVCAIVRTLYTERAATVLNVTPEQLGVVDGVFAQRGSNTGVSYWQLDLVDLAQSAATQPSPILMGGTLDQSTIQRLDLPAKISGAAFIQDMVRPGMLFGRVLRPSHPRDSLASFDVDAIKALPGVVRVVIDGQFVGIVAERDEQATHAVELARLSATWTRTAELPHDDQANGWMSAVAPRSTTFVQAEMPAPTADVRHSATYSRPYLAHASIGPSCAIAEWHGDALTVWSHSQGIYPLRRQLARTFAKPLDAVHVIHSHGAGCYGHNGADDVALDAALLARAVGAPVMCLWSRADELSWSPFGAAMTMSLAATLDDAGTISSWTYDVWSPPHLARPGFGDGVNLLAAADLAAPHPRAPDNDAPRPQGGGDRNAVPLYAFKHQTITHHLLPQGPLRSSAMRALGAHGNIFAIECFIDELAQSVGADPVAFRLKHLSDPRGVAVINAAARSARWAPNEPGGEGRGQGIGFARYKNLGAYFAVVAKVEITDQIRLVSMHAAVDAGLVIHRDGLINQIEGGIIQAASWTLKEQAGWTETGFSTRSWRDYPILNFSEVPSIEITIIEQPGEPSLGGGECAAGPVAAAIGNAIAHALGVRVRQMPLTPERISVAIQSH
jgi:nicotinate dehydrogenase subunit B